MLCPGLDAGGDSGRRREGFAIPFRTLIARGKTKRTNGKQANVLRGLLGLTRVRHCPTDKDTRILLVPVVSGVE